MLHGRGEQPEAARVLGPERAVGALVEERAEDAQRGGAARAVGILEPEPPPDPRRPREEGKLPPRQLGERHLVFILDGVVLRPHEVERRGDEEVLEQLDHVLVGGAAVVCDEVVELRDAGPRQIHGKMAPRVGRTRSGRWRCMCGTHGAQFPPSRTRWRSRWRPAARSGGRRTGS